MPSTTDAAPLPRLGNDLPDAPGRVLWLSQRLYDDVWRLQLELVGQRQRDEIPDTLVLVEHPHVLTMGRGTHRENLLAAGDMPVFEIERGGDITYHGPGQLVGYPILHLRQGERDLHAYLRALESALIEACERFGVLASRREGLTGVWTRTTPPRKLASLGIAVKKWVTLHGFALNVSTDLGRFSAINPCGLSATAMTSVQNEAARPVDLLDVARVVVPLLGQHLRRDFIADF